MSRRALDLDQLQAIVGREGNEACVDCGAENPMWASVTYGTLLCLEDAGKHRALGVQVSFVRSLDLDAWKDAEVASMMVSSNAFVNAFFALHGDASEVTIPRYLSLTAAKLRKLLARRREAYSESSSAAITGAEAGSASRDNMASASSAASAQIEDLSAEETTEVLDLQERFATRALEREASSRDTEEQRPWVPDELAPICMLCGRTFTMILRKHHCRKCGRVVCKSCAPANNSKPIPQLGYLSPVRHCRACFESAAITWPRHAPGPSPT